MAVEEEKKETKRKANKEMRKQTYDWKNVEISCILIKCTNSMGWRRNVIIKSMRMLDKKTHSVPQHLEPHPYDLSASQLTWNEVRRQIHPILATHTHTLTNTYPDCTVQMCTVLLHLLDVTNKLVFSLF